MHFSPPKELEFHNPLGFVFSDFFCIGGLHKTTAIDFDAVTKIKLVRERNALLNFVFLNLAVLFVGLLFYFQVLPTLARTALMLGALGFVGLTVFLKQYSYRVLIFTKDAQTIRVSITPNYKEEASEIVRFISRKIRRRNLEN